VRRDAAHARISAQLLESSTGNQLWAESYDAELEPSILFATQDQIARRVASTIADTTGVLAELGETEARRRSTDSLEAYDCVLLGQSYFKVHTTGVHARARACLERAVVIDPGYAEAWAHLAYIYREEFYHGYAGEPDPQARATVAAERAVALDATSSMAYHSLALTLFDQGQFEAGVAALERAIALNPDDSAMIAALSLYLAHWGRWERAIALTHEVEQLNPLHNRWIHFTRTMYYYRKGEFEQALVEATRLPRDVSQTFIHLAAIYAQLDRKTEAHAALQQLLEMDPNFAADPVDQLRRIFLRDVAVQRYLDGLQLAGLELE
jgi:tetratricopeptide (TPR) repeat protein